MFTCIEKDSGKKVGSLSSHITYPNEPLATGLTFASHCLLEKKEEYSMENSNWRREMDLLR